MAILICFFLLKLKKFDKKLLVYMGIKVNVQTLDILWPSEFTLMLTVPVSQQSVTTAVITARFLLLIVASLEIMLNAGITGIAKSKNETVCMKSLGIFDKMSLQTLKKFVEKG